ncbi:MAG TPA: T9SS type A sorting domain-containing protein [Bacteroidales bacterium]|nr:T9SS type A sorting domain-containing protein [Bacteroidales bacterium]HSA43837.1 T9SS type A sorting domain-containing protein [Bacteroidales bacterium]
MKYFFGLILCFLITYTFGTTYESVSDGDFLNPMNWLPLGGPPQVNTPGDSIIISHNMYIPATGQYSIVTAYMLIKGGGMLYTPNQTRIAYPGEVIVWGYMIIHNNLWMDPGGLLRIYYGGLVFVDNKVTTKDGGEINLHGGTICWENLWKGDEPTGVGVQLHMHAEYDQCYISTGPLGIDLLSFTAACEGKSVKLTWITENESNNHHFTVHRSRDLDDWEVVQTVPGQLNSSGRIQYSIVDHPPYETISYYRLSQTDTDGTETVFDAQWIRYVTCGKGSIPIASPNPVQDILFLSPGDSPCGLYVLYDHTGRRAAEVISAETGSVMDVRGLHAGLYFLRTPEGAMVKIIKQ